MGMVYATVMDKFGTYAVPEKTAQELVDHDLAKRDNLGYVVIDSDGDLQEALDELDHRNGERAI